MSSRTTRSPEPRPKATRHARPVARLVCAALAGLLLSGCAATVALRQGQQAEQAQDYDRAVVEYTKALKQKPGDTRVRLALERAKLRAAQDHFTRGRRDYAIGKLDEALVEFQIASEMNPSSSEVEHELEATRNALREKRSITPSGRTALQDLIAKSRQAPPSGFSLPADLKVPDSLVFRDASARDIFTALARFAGVSIVFDPAFQDSRLTIDLHHTTLQDALAAVTQASGTFYDVTAPRTIVVAPDTAAKRREYEQDVVRTFYLSNADLKETVDLLRMVVDARRIAPITANNAITIQDTPERVAAAGRIIEAIDKARPEVVIDTQLLEVDRTKLLEYGLNLASTDASGNVQAGISGSAAVNSGTLTLDKLRNLSQSDILLANLPALYYRLLKSDTDTRTLANPQLRTSDGIPAEARFGDRVPVPVTTFTPIATGGTPQQPIVSYNYENIGVNIDITPRIHHDDDVSLALKIDVSSISGTGYGGLPTFGNREINTVIRLKDGETSMLAGLIRDDERDVLEGVPGLSDLPIIGRLFAHTQKQNEQTDVILTLTPHIVRVLDLKASDLAPFRVGRESLTPTGELAVPVAPPPPKPGQQPVPGGTRAKPITPKTPVPPTGPHERR
ncbi:MAG TPA: secretin N-terminal domain-containing protein [Vicinamibacterales bacterium]|nr:secretin N-terminal domain-containing protein [Vicinamibacterales bacterium]